MFYLGIVIFTLCLVHYIYQVIILPSIRQSARDDLFLLRDKLRAQLIQVQNQCDKNTLRAFKEIDDGINRSLNRLHLLTLSNLVKVSIAIKKDPERTEEHFKKFHSLLDNSQDSTPKDIYLEVGKVLRNVLAANSIMFVVYVLPFIIIINLIKNTYSTLIKTVNYMSDMTLVIKNINAIDRISNTTKLA